MIGKYDPDVVKNLMPLIVNVLGRSGTKAELEEKNEVISRAKPFLLDMITFVTKKLVHFNLKVIFFLKLQHWLPLSR